LLAFWLPMATSSSRSDHRGRHARAGPGYYPQVVRAVVIVRALDGEPRRCQDHGHRLHHRGLDLGRMPEQRIVELLQPERADRARLQAWAGRPAHEHAAGGVGAIVDLELRAPGQFGGAGPGRAPAGLRRPVRCAPCGPGSAWLRAGPRSPSRASAQCSAGARLVSLAGGLPRCADRRDWTGERMAAGARDR
jgi:hypothetical protein